MFDFATETTIFIKRGLILGRVKSTNNKCSKKQKMSTIKETVRKTIIGVETGSSFPSSNQDGTEVEVYQFRITTNDGKQYMCWSVEDFQPKTGHSYDIEYVEDKTVPFNDEKPQTYKKVRLRNPKEVKHTINQSIDKTLTEQPRMVMTGSDVEYHKMAMDYLWRTDRLDLINLSRLAPVMKSICEGTISDKDLGLIGGEFHNTRA
jgi:hypothetical protein